MIVQLERYQNQVDPEQFEGTHQVSSSLTITPDPTGGVTKRWWEKRIYKQL